MIARTFVSALALVAGCAPPPRPPVVDDVALVLQRAASDFRCPVERVQITPCTCAYAVAVNACGVDALYAYAPSSDGPPSISLAFAVFPRARSR